MDAVANRDELLALGALMVALLDGAAEHGTCEMRVGLGLRPKDAEKLVVVAMRPSEYRNLERLREYEQQQLLEAAKDTEQACGLLPGEAE